jgi:hypothetical protein
VDDNEDDADDKGKNIIILIKKNVVDGDNDKGESIMVVTGVQV